MAKKAKTAVSRIRKDGAEVLGRSPLTGKLVFAPVSKGGSVSVEQVRAAIATLRKEKS